jgi:N-acylglucosamine-6-phosphate 2-epimerase
MVFEPRFRLEQILAAIRGRLIVSCQAQPSEPLFGSDIMAKMARAAQEGGAAAIRANTPVDIAAIRQTVDLPIFGLFKVDIAGFDVYITPRLQDAVAVAGAGADVIALDATERPHPEGTAARVIDLVRAETGLPVMADISTFEEAVAARDAGADFVSTTMSGYTPYSPPGPSPDFDLVRRLAREFGSNYPLIAEGRIGSPESMRAAFDAGAFAVVVGGAITRPQLITAGFVAMLPNR